jgi:hypothetical protein
MPQSILRVCRPNRDLSWHVLRTFFAFPGEIGPRREIYNQQARKEGVL